MVREYEQLLIYFADSRCRETHSDEAVDMLLLEVVEEKLGDLLWKCPDGRPELF